MIRFYLKSALLGVILCTTAALLIHAQIYDDSELRALLLPEGCPAPCFMGIRPGVTTADEAIALLKQNAWVNEVHVDYFDGAVQSTGAISWTWHPNIPAFIPNITTAWLTIEDGKANQINLPSLISLSQIWLLMNGTMDYQVATFMNGESSDRGMLYTSIYLQQHIWVGSYRRCPYFTSLWDSPVDVHFFTDLGANSTYPSEVMHDHLFLRRVRDLDRLNCKD